VVDISGMSGPPNGYATRPGEGASALDPTLKASRDTTGGALTVYETDVDAGPPLHVHTREDESLYVIEGEISVRCGEETFGAPAGSFVFLPRGIPHRFWSSGPRARVLLLAVPAGIEDYFAEINVAATAEELRRVGERYGIRVVSQG
jgi:quercetin dioxygenase-like cupin family protein